MTTLLLNLQINSVLLYKKMDLMAERYLSNCTVCLNVLFIGIAVG
jgi:hypothetical protein